MARSLNDYCKKITIAPFNVWQWSNTKCKVNFGIFHGFFPTITATNATSNSPRKHTSDSNA